MPWAGKERYAEAQENPADVKAAERMARLYDEILRNNPEAEKAPKERHKLNVFLSRLLFCFFAEDTDIFPNTIFSKAIHELTEEDGSDLDSFLNQLFEVLNTENRKGCIDQLCKFPYVNGGLFGDSYDAPKMTRRARRMIIDCGALDWSEINPDIFGSMIQAVVAPEQRGGLGMHYTSVPNIMKVIEPLFLNDLWEEFENAKNNTKKLAKLLNRISRIRFFDPACGSGNFLIITYKEIRKLEMAILEQRQRLDGYIPLHSLITLDHFYGIEIDDFAHEVAILSLWLAEHLMNVQFKKKFGDARPALPLKEAGNVVCGNACRLDWTKVCPAQKEDEVFIMGNPPYLGARMQTAEHKADLIHVCSKHGKAKNIDYIFAWFFKAADFIKESMSKFSFVSTNSICQGEQVDLLWSPVLSNRLEIFFAHKSFKWTNNAKYGAGVICVVVGVQNKSKVKKYLYEKTEKRLCGNINPYLSDAPDIFVKRTSRSISRFPRMIAGNKAVDGGHLFLDPADLEKAANEGCSHLIRKVVGADEFLNGKQRWCLWITEDTLEEALKFPFVEDRIKKTEKYRNNKTDSGAKYLAKFPYRFREMNKPRKNAIFIPTVSSERREYIPLGYLGKDDVVIAPNQVIYDPGIFIFGVLSSRMHMVWVQTVAGRLKTDYRYSSVLCYNTFPMPSLSNELKEMLGDLAYKVLDVRDEHVGMTMAELYDPDKMPNDLRIAHHQLDLAVDSCYRNKSFESDSDRLEHLFKLYIEMTA